jgi:hypothetical protein
MKIPVRSIPLLVLASLALASLTFVPVKLAGQNDEPADLVLLAAADAPPKILPLKWEAPKEDAVCPANSIIRNLSSAPLVIVSRDGFLTFAVEPGKSVFVADEFRFQKVPEKAEMTTLAAVRFAHTGGEETCRENRKTAVNLWLLENVWRGRSELTLFRSRAISRRGCRWRRDAGDGFANLH